jgi:hypothetical protein
MQVNGPFGCPHQTAAQHLRRISIVEGVERVMGLCRLCLVGPRLCFNARLVIEGPSHGCARIAGCTDLGELTGPLEGF